jgi:hypothetical protein
MAGAGSGAVFGGVGRRIVMRTVALIDESAYGVRTDSGATVVVITVGGTITLTIATILAGIIGGVVYIAIRRLLRSSGVARGSHIRRTHGVRSGLHRDRRDRPPDL